MISTVTDTSCRPHPEPLLYLRANLNAAGTTKRVVTTACVFMGQCLGNVRVVSPRPMFRPTQWATGHADAPQVVGPQLFLSSEAPYYHTGLYATIGAWSAVCLLCVIMGAYLKYLNRRQGRRRLALGLPEQLEDMSIMTA